MNACHLPGNAAKILQNYQIFFPLLNVIECSRPGEVASDSRMAPGTLSLHADHSSATGFLLILREAFHLAAKWNSVQKCNKTHRIRNKKQNYLLDKLSAATCSQAIVSLLLEQSI